MALIPSFFLDTVVSLGIKNNDGSYHWSGTGFLIGLPSRIGENKSYVYLITNKHVFNNNQKMIINFNPVDDSDSKVYDLDLIDENGNPTWVGHPDVDIDIGVLHLNAGKLQDEGIDLKWFEKQHTLNTQELKDKTVSEGNHIYTLGYPLGYIGNKRQYVIVRSGTISRIREMLDENSKDFLVDSFVFPGNSGGPVITEPEITSINGTLAHSEASLIGIVKSYIPYQDTAVSTQTGKPRVIFEENTGLAAVHSVDQILETIDLYNNIYSLEIKQDTEGNT